MLLARNFENYARGGGICVVIATNKYKDILPQLDGIKNVLAISNVNLPRYDLCKLDSGALATVREKVHAVADMLQDDKSKQVLLTIVEDCARRDIFSRLWEKVFYGDEQYYPPDIVQLGQEESFVDCGAYDGDSIKTFLEKVNRQFAAVYAFEMEKENFKALTNYVACETSAIRDKIKLFNCGVWNEATKFFIQTGQGVGSSVVFASSDKTTGEQVNLLSFDEVLADKKVSFIKMDIEGAELEALHGAKNLIRAWRPKLAISIYHKYEDFYEIPLYIKSLMSDYKIYFRCHTYLDQDFICYAI